MVLKGVLFLFVVALPMSGASGSTAALIAPESVRGLIEKELSKSFTVASKQITRGLAKDWGGRRVRRLEGKSMPRLSSLFDAATRQNVDVVVIAEVETKGRRRRPYRLHLGAIDVGRRKWLGRLAIGLKSKRKKSRLRLSKPGSLKQYFSRIADGIVSDASERLRSPSEPESGQELGRTPSAQNKPEMPSEKLSAEDLGDRSDTSSEKVSVLHSNSAIAGPSDREIRRVRGSRADRRAEIQAYGLSRGRSFGYFDSLSGNLREFDSGLSFGGGLRAELYPLRIQRRSGTTRRIGIVGGFARDFGSNPAVADVSDVTLEHRWREWFAGAVVAWDFSDILLKASANYGVYSASFVVPSDFDAANELPGVEYQFVGLGGAARYEHSEFAAFAEAQYNFIRRGGPVGEVLFPNSALGGLSLRSGLGYRLVDSVEVFSALRYEHFFYDLRPQRGDEFIAGGALDQHLTVELGVSYAY